MPDFTLIVRGKKVFSGTLETGAVLPPLGFTLADDFLPPASLKNLSDAQLKARPELWPFEVFRKHRSGIRNVPATVTTLKKGLFTQNAAWLEYWADNCALAWFNVDSFKKLRGTAYWAEFEKLWLWLTKGTEVITNNKGWDDGYYDPVSEQNKGKQPMGIDALLMECNVFEPLDYDVQTISGQTGFLFRSFDGQAAPPDIKTVNYKTHPFLWSRADIIMRNWQRDPDGNRVEYLPNGHLGVDPFPQGWSKGAVTPMPVICMPNNQLAGGVNLVPENRVHLTGGLLTLFNYVPNPFNPERELR